MTIPSTILFVAHDGIPNLAQLSISDSNSCPEFDRWRRVRQLRIAVDFRRILRSGSGLPDLKRWTLDLPALTQVPAVGRGSQASMQIYRRPGGGSDGELIAVKSVHLSESLDTAKIENEIENLVNLRHPLIAAPIGFALMGKSAGVRELKIARSYGQSGTLAEVITAPPPWWTPTAKAKAAVGIALSLRFAHGLGLLHGRLTAENVFFEADGCIQILDFGAARLAAPGAGGFYGEGWSPAVDTAAFAAILAAIVDIHRAPQSSAAKCKTAGAPAVPAFVSALIEEGLSAAPEKKPSFVRICAVLKQNGFRILAGVDSEAVSAFVAWVESQEGLREWA
jgi:serine/threonine protein kinase